MVSLTVRRAADHSAVRRSRLGVGIDHMTRVLSVVVVAGVVVATSWPRRGP